MPKIIKIGQLKIHYIKFNKKYDEWIEIDSNRILSDDPDSCDEDDQHIALSATSQRKKEVLGALIDKVDASLKQVFSSFNIIESINSNIDAIFSRFKVDVLTNAAKYLKIELQNPDGKKLLKRDIAENIVRKIESLMPGECTQCKELYTVGLEDVPIFTCHLCDKGSHNCTSMSDFKASLPTTLVSGYGYAPIVCEKKNLLTVPDQVRQ